MGCRRPFSSYGNDKNAVADFSATASVCRKSPAKAGLFRLQEVK